MTYEEYKTEYAESIRNNTKYWGKKGKEVLQWDTPFTTVYNNKFIKSEWYDGGKLNACLNCIDRHLEKNPDKVAIIYTDNNNQLIRYTYKECLINICKIAEHFVKKGLRKKDVVTIYMPMCPEAVFSMLACARLGIVHNVVFGGFSSDSLILRIKDSRTKYLVTTDVVDRVKSKISFWDTVEKALESVVLDVLVFDNDKPISYKGVTNWSEIKGGEYKFIEPVSMESEDALFYLYTSGSTGTPKGMIHTTAGYLVYTVVSLKACFSIQDDDVFACTADIGWITGHTYSVYGPLLLGITTVIFGGTPVYPDHYRLFSLVESCAITQLYTAPTVIRTLKKYFEANTMTETYNLKSLRLLGSVGEPINKEAYKWFTESFNNLHIVDTYWQTETGGIIIAPIPNTVLGQPECASLPVLGIDPIIVKPGSNQKMIYETEPYELGHILIKQSWPGIARCILNDRKRYESAYFSYGDGYYFTGDEGYKDKDGLFWIRGRADDVINVSGHRLSTAEIESAACTDKHVAEAAVVSVDDEITGQGLYVFVVPKTVCNAEDECKLSVRNTLRSKIGKLVTPKGVYVCKGLPKTATGKIMRRVLKDVLSGNVSDDLSTCINVESIDAIKSMHFMNKI